MFLHQLQETGVEELFIELATLVAGAEPRKGSHEEWINEWTKENHPISEPGFTISNFEDKRDDTGAFLYPTEAERKTVEHFYAELSLLNKSSRSIFNIDSKPVKMAKFFAKTNYKDLINSCIKEAEKNADYKKQVLSLLIEEDIDLSKIKNKKMREVLVFIPEVRQTIIKSLVDELFSKFEDELAHITIQQKKVILFELIGLAYADHDFHDLEKFTIELICEKLGLESELIEEFCDLSGSISQAVLEAAEIINE
mgnify:CR=1 FL=1